MTQWTAISNTNHARSRYWPRDGYHFTSDQQAVPVLIAELGKLLPHYALGFVKESDAYVPVALTGLGQGNLYLHPEGKWMGPYVPAALRGYPFRLADNAQGEKVVCIASDHLTEDPSATPLFDDAGNLAKPVAETLEFFKETEQNRKVTQACVQKLEDAGVIEKWPLEIGRGQGQEPLKVNGLYQISQKALNGLDADTLHALRGGPLSLAHAQMLSTHQLTQLTKRAKLLAEVKSGNAQKIPKNFNALFDSDDDKLTFDFNA